MKSDRFFKKKLSNGLTILFEKRELPVVSSAVGINFGALYESEKEKGISHLIEHMLFKGTKKRGYEELSKEIEKKGGILNGYTGEEATVFWSKLPSKHVDTGIEIISDIILNPAFSEEEFEKEKGIVIEEINMYHDNPVYYVHDKIKELLYEAPFGMSIAGTIEIVKSLTREDVKDFFNKNYKTDKMVLCVVGDAEFDFICKKAESLFPESKTEFNLPEIRKKNLKIVETRKGLDQAHLILGIHSPNLGQKEKYAYDIALAYLAGGMSSVLFNEIRQKRGLAYDLRADSDIGRNYGYLTIYAGAKKENLDEIERIIKEEIGKLKNFQQKDLDDAREQLIGLKKVEEESSSRVMSALIAEEFGEGAEAFYDYDENVMAVRLEDVRKIGEIMDFSSLRLIPE